MEVSPILEVLVGKTVEQSLLEVMEEEELMNLREQQRVFEELRNAEQAEQQRLEEQERRRTEEKVRNGRLNYKFLMPMLLAACHIFYSTAFECLGLSTKNGSSYFSFFLLILFLQEMSQSHYCHLHLNIWISNV